MTYVTINFPKTYDGTDLYLKDVVSEREGIQFAMAVMYRVLASQVDSITSSD